jgi:hypothetical protein
MVIEFKEYDDKEVYNLNKQKVIERLNHFKKSKSRIPWKYS